MITAARTDRTAAAAAALPRRWPASRRRVVFLLPAGLALLADLDAALVLLGVPAQVATRRLPPYTTCSWSAASSARWSHWSAPPCAAGSATPRPGLVARQMLQVAGRLGLDHADVTPAVTRRLGRDSGP